MNEPRLCYLVIHEDDLLDMLRRCEHGETPDVVYAEWYANSEHKSVPPKTEQ